MSVRLEYIGGYKGYLETTRWKRIRWAKLWHAGFRCELCGRQDVSLEVHHNDYSRLGEERPEDLVCLCRDCHEAHEGRLPGAGERVESGGVRG